MISKNKKVFNNRNTYTNLFTLDRLAGKKPVRYLAGTRGIFSVRLQG